MVILSTNNLRKTYGKGESEVKALDGVNLEVEEGEFVSIVGTSGSGKSTLLHMLGGLDRPDSGDVYVNDVDYAVTTGAPEGTTELQDYVAQNLTAVAADDAKATTTYDNVTYTFTKAHPTPMAAPANTSVG